MTVRGFAELVVIIGCSMLVTRLYERELELAATVLHSPLGMVSVAALVFWTLPLKELGYFCNRLGAIRGQLHNIAPYAPSLMSTLPGILPYTGKVVDNIERVGAFMPIMMQPGCKEYVIPLMPKLMPDLEVMLDAAPTLAPVMPRIAPSLDKILPYAKQLLPYSDALVCIVEVDGWEKLNDYMNVLAPCIDKVAPYTKDLAPYLPQMAPYMPILTKHIDNLTASMDETVTVLDRLMPLLPLLPAADQAGLLNQRLAFKALPKVLKRSFLSNEMASAAALKGASVHLRMVDKLQEMQTALSNKYQLYMGAPKTPPHPMLMDIDDAEDEDALVEHEEFKDDDEDDEFSK
ncbi:Hypothetical Protein FCC1311_082462 [Hondaea fermentalgiana]|uniref:Uncharacterized protein n=1 Tax=Hondaea fermentalgiana TaxID=2315210 RepID=A0A2R5GUG6_9STRA|nr:Hypothetical Protein FCC1311_082462 [Hondaea fermentalgiana]|eukprot:GBG32021.1 Hypothetical Protein FCC1311_082462 [Hondaea fermentalgiana]